MSDFWHTVAVMVYFAVLFAITCVAVAFVVVGWWERWWRPDREDESEDD